MDEIAQLRQTYFQECDEVLSEFEGHLMALDEGRGNAETLRAAFRAIHSIKGGASAFGYRRLVNFAHALETLLDKLRNGSATLTADTISLLLRAADIVADLVRAAQSGAELIEKHESAVLTPWCCAPTPGAEADRTECRADRCQRQSDARPGGQASLPDRLQSSAGPVPAGRRASAADCRAAPERQPDGDRRCRRRAGVGRLRSQEELPDAGRSSWKPQRRPKRSRKR